jgi:hypothetical protein
MAGNVTERSIKLNVTAEADPSMMSNVERWASQASGRISDAAVRANAVNQSLHGTARIGKTGPMFQEFGRGLEDFIVGFSMAKNSAEGLALGLRGAANNMGQLAALSGSSVAPYIAIGASLSTIIVPKMVEWLFNTKEAEKAAAAYEERLKSISVLAKSIAEDRILFGGMDQDTFEKEEKKRKDQLAVMIDVAAAQKREIDLIQGKIAAVDELNEKENQVAAQRATQATKSGGNFAAFTPTLVSKTALETNLKAAMTEYEKTTKEMDKLRAGLDRAEDASDEAKSRSIIKRDEERRKWQKKQELEEWEQSNQFDAFVAEQRKQRAIKSIDEQIEAQQSKLEGLQDRQSNPNGPSAHAFFGSQTTASIINRAISGSATVEDTLKAQLKVEKEQLKELQRQKKAMTIRI